jgi:DNA-binding NarL/FixJ family response regulator
MFGSFSPDLVYRDHVRDLLLGIGWEAAVKLHAEYFPDFLARYQSRLTRCELEICRLMDIGLDAADIAEKTFRSVRTIYKHDQHIHKKLQLNRHQRLHGRIRSAVPAT